MLANSKNTQSRITKYYRRDSKILYPPVETDRFAQPVDFAEILLEKMNLETNRYYVIISALTEFKKIEIAIQ